MYDMLSGTRINFWCWRFSRSPKLSSEIVNCLFMWFHICNSLFICNKSVWARNGPELKETIDHCSLWSWQTKEAKLDIWRQSKIDRQTTCSTNQSSNPGYYILYTWYCMHLRPLNHRDAPKFVILHSIFLHSNHSAALHKPNRVRKSMWSVSLKLPCSLKTLWILACVCVFMSACTYVCVRVYMCVWPIMSLWRGHLAVDSQSLPGAAV